MLEDVQLRNFSAGTQRSCIQYVCDFATYYQTSPDRLGLDEVRNYQLYLIERRRLSSKASVASSPPPNSSTRSRWKCLDR